MCKCGSLRRSGRRRRRKRRGVGQSSETCSQWSTAVVETEASLSCLNGFSCSWEETKAGSRAESHSVQWGRSSGCEGGSTGVCWQTTKTWEWEKNNSVRLLRPVCLSVGESCCHKAPKQLNNFPHGIRSEIFQDFQSISLSLKWTSLTLLKTNFVYAEIYINIYYYSSMLSNSLTLELPWSSLID